MTTGIAVSNSILIVQFVGTLRPWSSPEASPRRSLRSAFASHSDDHASTILASFPWRSLWSRQRTVRAASASNSRRLTVSGIVTVFLVPTAYLLIHRKEVRDDEIVPRSGECPMHKRSLFLPLWLLLCPVAIHAQEIVSQQIEQLPDAPQPHAQAQQRTLALNSATTNSSDSSARLNRRNAYTATGGAVGAQEQPTNQRRGTARSGTKAVVRETRSRCFRR